MPQIAQQDYIFINVPDGGDVKDVFSQEIATDYYKRGVLLDVIFVLHFGINQAYARVLSFDVDNESGGVIVGFTYENDGELFFREY